jgi:hypothetical protein
LDNKEKYFQLEQEENDIKEKQRQNESDIRSNEYSALSSSDPIHQANLTNRAMLNTELAKKQSDILSISQRMREQLKIMRSLLENSFRTSTSLYLPSAIHTRSRLRRTRY